MISVIIIITSVYLILILSFSYGIIKNNAFGLERKPSIQTFSIIIPFRNEEIHLWELLNSLVKINYPKNKFEFIFVNDESTDTSVKIIEEFLSKTALNFYVVNNLMTSSSPKKDAINTAVQIANFEWIVTTDADCTVPKYWLQLFDELSKVNNSVMMVGPVSYSILNTSFFRKFSTIRFLKLASCNIGRVWN